MTVKGLMVHTIKSTFLGKEKQKRGTEFFYLINAAISSQTVSFLNTVNK
jgi:hypothetical protein